MPKLTKVPELVDMPMIGDVYQSLRYADRRVEIVGKEYNGDLTITYLTEPRGPGGKQRKTRVHEKALRWVYERVDLAERQRVHLGVRTVLILEDFLVEREPGKWS